MTRTSTAAEEWLLPVIVLKVVTVIAVLVSAIQASVWATICLMTMDLKYAWWLWSTLIAGAVIASFWAYNAILVRIVDDEPTDGGESETVTHAD